MDAAGLEEVLRKIFSGPRRLLDDSLDLFLPGHAERLMLFRGRWRGRIEVVRAGAFVVAYKPGLLRRLRKPAAEWLAEVGDRWLTASSSTPLEAYDVVRDLAGADFYADRVLFDAGDESVIAVFGVDDSTGRAFAHLVPPGIAAAAAIAPQDALEDESFVRELMGFDVQPWEEPGRGEGVRLRVQGDLVLRLTPVDAGEALPVILSLAHAAVAGYEAVVASVRDAVEALEQASKGGDVDPGDAFQVFFTGALARRMPCARRLYGHADVEEAAWRRLSLIEVDVDTLPLDNCSLSELAGPGAAALLASKPPPTLDFDLEIGASYVVERWRRALEGDLDAVAFVAKAISQLHPGVERDDFDEFKLPLGTVARLHAGYSVVRLQNAAELVAAATVAETLRTLGLIRLGRGGGVVAGTLGNEALAGPATIELEAHTATFEEASIVRLPEAFKRLIYLKNALQVLEPLFQELEAHRAHKPRTIASLAKTSPGDAVEIARLAARLAATYTPSTLLVLPRGQRVIARHPEHGVAEAEIPWPAIAEPGHMPNLNP